MIVKKITLYKYHIALKKEIAIKGCLLKKREGVLLKIISDDGSISLGEISPLPGLHQESLDKAIGDLRDLSKILPGKDLADVLKNRMASSVRYGLEMAMMHKVFSDLARSLKKDRAVLIPVSALAFAASKNIKEEIKKIIDKGYANIKVKVGRARLDQEIIAINHISDMLSNEKKDIRLRIDSNASWDLKDAVHFAKSIDKRHIDYIEDPIRQIKEYPIFYQETELPIALDERFEDFEKEFALSGEIGFLKAVIIKPNYIGGFSRSEEIINEYGKKGICCVLSNSFETGLSISSIILFACRMGLADVAIGIDTLKYFKNDILKNPITIQEGCIDLSQIELDENNIDFSILEKIS